MKAESHSAEAESAPVAARADRVEADFTPVVVRATVVFAESVARAATRTETAALFPSTLPEAPSPEAATRAAPADRAGASAKFTAAPADRARREADGVAAEAAFVEAEGETAAVEEERGRPESRSRRLVAASPPAPRPPAPTPRRLVGAPALRESSGWPALSNPC